MTSAHRARKRFGQNFLTDQSVVESIIACIAPRPEDNVVEIGPGLGALTKPLLNKLSSLQAIELDRDLIKKLLTLPNADRLILHNADALAFDFSTLLPTDSAAGRLRIVGNLPYNISSPLLFHLLDCRHLIHDMHFMLQKEVVERICAVPGNKTYGRLSVMMQNYCEVYPLLDVPPEAFDPAPKVQSAIIRLIPKPPESTPSISFTVLQRVVRQAFSAKRKTLRNNFRGELTPEVLQAANFDPSVRAETLETGQFVELAQLWLEHHPET